MKPLDLRAQDHTRTAFPSPRPSPQGRGGRQGRLFTIMTRQLSSTGGRRFSLSPRERAGVRGKQPCQGLRCSISPRINLNFRYARVFFGVGLHHWPAVIWHRLWCAFLQSIPNHIANSFHFAAQSSIPKTQHFYSACFQPSIARGVFAAFLRMAMLPAIQFNIYKSFYAKKIKQVRPKGMLPAKFVAGKPPVAQPAPQQTLRPGIVLAQHACYMNRGHKASIRRAWEIRKRKTSATSLSPSPRPSSSGRGRNIVSPWRNRDAFAGRIRSRETFVGVLRLKELCAVDVNSLSPRERVRVRGKETSDAQKGANHSFAAYRSLRLWQCLVFLLLVTIIIPSSKAAENQIGRAHV